LISNSSVDLLNFSHQAEIIVWK